MANKAYQFPQGQPNPFAEPGAPKTPAGSENPFAVSQEPVRSVNPGPDAYQQTLVPRGGLLLFLSLAGLIGSFIALAVAFCMLPLGVFSLMASVPALLMGRQDLLAMRHGAMEKSQHSLVMLSWVFAIIGSALGAISLAICITLFVIALIL
jgi:hypothetical protein